MKSAQSRLRSGIAFHGSRAVAKRFRQGISGEHAVATRSTIVSSQRFQSDGGIRPPPVESESSTASSSAKTSAHCCLVPVYEDLSALLGLATPAQFVAGVERSYHVLGSALSLVPGTANVKAGLKQLGQNSEKDVPSSPLDTSVASVLEASKHVAPSLPGMGESSKKAMLTDATKTADNDGGKSEEAKKADEKQTTTVDVTAANSRSKEFDFSDFVSEDFAAAITHQGQNAWKKGVNLFGIAHHSDRILSSKIVEVALEGKKEFKDKANFSVSSTGDVKAPGVEDTLFSFCRTVLTEKGLFPNADEQIATSRVSAALAPAADEATRAVQQKRRDALLEKVDLSVKVLVTVVVPPERFAPHFKWFFDRLQDCPTDLERRNAAFVYSRSHVYAIFKIVDLFCRVVLRKPMPIYPGALPLRAIGLPDNFLTVPFRVQKVVTMQFVPAKAKWRVDFVEVAGFSLDGNGDVVDLKN